MKKFIISLLQKRAKVVLDKFKPRVVAITGSVGKTSAKQAIALVLSTKYKIRTAEKNFNNEIGVPLTILGMKSPGRNPFGWLTLFWKSYFIKTYPEMLILEYGADHPGDIKNLCDLASPDVAIITGISPVHAEFFKDIDHLADEKSEIIKRLPDNGVAILNGDDKRVLTMQTLYQSFMTYGTKETDIQADEITLSTRLDDHFSPGELFIKTHAVIKLKDKEVGRLELKNAIGYASVLACLSALTVADHFGISFAMAIQKLNSDFRAMPGRLNPIAGIKGSLIIDDSYNAAPLAMQNGLDVLKSFSLSTDDDRRIAVLGQMAELGQYTENEHRLIGMKVAECADLFLAVGENMRIAVESAKESGLDPNAIEWFANSEEAGRYLDREVKTGDIVYVKGSQSTRMEKVVKDIMAEPARADERLVRQDEKWLKV